VQVTWRQTSQSPFFMQLLQSFFTIKLLKFYVLQLTETSVHFFFDFDINNQGKALIRIVAWLLLVHFD
jgi:hypothetical protein